MRNVKIATDDAIAICMADEGHFLDKKTLEVSGKSLQKLAVAFGNADGGEIYIGIVDSKSEADPTKRWIGAKQVEDFNGLLQALFSVSPTLGLMYEALFTEGMDGYVLRISVDKSSAVHKTDAGKVYIRYGAQSLPVEDPQKIIELSFAKGAATYEDQRIDSVAPEQIVESRELRKFLQGYSPKTDPLDFLRIV